MLGNPEVQTSIECICQTYSGQTCRKDEIRMSILKNHRTPLEPPVREGVEIVNAEAHFILDSKLDNFLQQRRMIRDIFMSYFD